MKNLKKIMALVIAMVMMVAMSTSVFAETKITINRDSSWKPTAELQTGESNQATYTYYKIFDAAITDQGTVNAKTGATTGGVAVYTISGTDAAAKVAALPSDIFEAKLAADSKYYITMKSTYTGGAAGIVTALKTMVAANTTLFPGTAVTSNENPVVITPGGDGYYLIEASNGKDLAVQSIGEVTINEKNDYPTIDKKQKQADDTEYHDTVEPAEIGSYIDYQVTVHIPADANKQIAVIDKMSAGLEYDSTTSLTLSPNVAYAALTSEDAGYDSTITSTNGWQIKLEKSVVEANRNRDIVITFRAKVTSAALSDTSKENEVTLNYDNNNYILKDKVNYETYFAGIYKVDPNDANADMSGVKFTLTDKNDRAVNVTYDSTNGYYVVGGTSNEVETRADGSNYTIKIRGLDNELEKYKLTETVTKAGYNLLETPAELTLTKDEGDAFSGKVANTYDRVENNKGSVLPSTGGIGTTIFYVIGAILVLGAGILLVSKRRMSAN